MTFHAFGKDHGMETPYIESSYDADMHGETLSSADAALKAEHSALQDPLVLAARAFEYDEQVLLAVLTEPIYLSSDRAALKALLIKNAEAATENTDADTDADTDANTDGTEEGTAAGTDATEGSEDEDVPEPEMVKVGVEDIVMSFVAMFVDSIDGTQYYMYNEFYADISTADTVTMIASTLPPSATYIEPISLATVYIIAPTTVA